MRLIIPVVSLVLVACDGLVSPVCGCSPIPPPSAFVRGTVSTAAGEAVAGIRLRPEAGSPSCESFHPSTHGTAITDADGGFVLQVYTVTEGATCIRVFARDTAAGSPEVALNPTIQHTMRAWPQDTVVVTLRYPM